MNQAADLSPSVDYQVSDVADNASYASTSLISLLIFEKIEKRVEIGAQSERYSK